jgi:hypothetical protein
MGSMAAIYTPRRGQFLALIYFYTKIHGCSLAERDIQKYFRISVPAVHEMVVAQDNRGFIEREPGKARSIRLLLSRDQLPDLK